MAPRLIYLDQWAWIQLARVNHGKDKNRALSSVLDFVRAAIDTGIARFPLTLGHYIETQNHKNLERRKRLAQFMIEISRLDTLAAPRVIVRHEVDVALKRFFPDRVTVETFNLVGKGIWHTSSSMPRDFKISDNAGALSEESRQRWELAGLVFELGCLAGPEAVGFKLPAAAKRRRPPHDVFVEILDLLPKEFEALPDDDAIRDRSLYKRCILDIKGIVDERLAAHGISGEEFVGLQERIFELVDMMPSRRIDMHLLREFARNRQLPRRKSDLNDFGYLGIAAGYCDVVVAEKQFTDLINRGDLKKKAVVISKLQDLPRV